MVPVLSESTFGARVLSPGDVYSTLGLFVRLEPFQKKKKKAGVGGEERKTYIIVYNLLYSAKPFPSSLADCC